MSILGITGAFSLLSYAAAVIFSPLAFPGYDALAQAVSDLSAVNAPSRMLWDRLAAVYDTCSVMCITCVTVYVSEKELPKLFKLGVYLYCIMEWISRIGYQMFPLSDSGKEIAGMQETMHIVVTAAVVLLSIVSLILLIIAGARHKDPRGGEQRIIGVFAAIALAMMFIGAIGQGAVPPEYFGIVERFSVFAAVGFNAVLGIWLFTRKD